MIKKLKKLVWWLGSDSSYINVTAFSIGSDAKEIWHKPG
jgi:hypothetical protein